MIKTWMLKDTKDARRQFFAARAFLLGKKPEGISLPKGAEQAFFIAEEGGAPVSALWARPGSFGLFASKNAPLPVEALLLKCAQWQKAHGAGRFAGPVSPGEFVLGQGVQISGFEHGPIPFLEDTPEHYPRLLEHCGMERVKTQISFEMDLTGFDHGFYEDLSARVLKRFPAEIEPLRMGNGGHMRLVHHILAQAGILPGGADANGMRRAFLSFRPFYRPGYGHIVRMDGEGAGLILGLSDAPRHIFGGKREEVLCVATQAVHPAYKNRGVNALLYHALYAAARQNGVGRVYALSVEAENAPSIAAISRAGGREVRRTALYQKAARP